jgi:broad specificity phosphatase PhoE
MRSLYLLLFVCASIFTSCDTKTSVAVVTPIEEDVVTTYYFIRHAEKDRSDPENRNPALTELGQERAQNWMRVFKDIALDAVYSTDYNRTQQTAAPTAQSKSLNVESYNPRTLNDSLFSNATQGKTVLVVGHSNTTPSFVNAVIGTKTYGDIDDSNNGNLYVVRVQGDRKEAQLLHVN